MPEPTVVAPVAPTPIAFGQYVDFHCSHCQADITAEPRCSTCSLCVACCGCRLCEICGRETSRTCEACFGCIADSGPACCQCAPCPRCMVRRARAALCPDCGTCTRASGGVCCRCWTCRGCNVRFTRRSPGQSSCGNCARCLDCCQCLGIRHINQQEPTFHVVPVGEVDQRTEKGTPPPKYLVENNSRRFISTEIEVSGVTSSTNRNTVKVLRKWGGAIVGDGSLGGGGFEINTAPAAGDVFAEEIEEICEALILDGGFADHHAGAHVHIDARDFRFYDVRRLVFLYQKIENALYGLVAPGRAANHFSAPCGDLYVRNLKAGLVPKANKIQILKNLYNRAPDRALATVRRDKGAANRYHGLNLHSWMHRGSIECRIMHGSTDPEKLINWGVLWAHILDFAMKSKESDIMALNKKGIQILLEDIAHNDSMRRWIENRWAFFHRNRR